MSASLALNPNLTCERCGRYGAYEFDGERLCADCYELRGSCCPEFGGDDQWERNACERPATPTTDTDDAHKGGR